MNIHTHVKEIMFCLHLFVVVACSRRCLSVARQTVLHSQTTALSMPPTSSTSLASVDLQLPVGVNCLFWFLVIIIKGKGYLI